VDHYSTGGVDHFSVVVDIKGTTINKKIRLDYELLRLPETRIFKWSGYKMFFL